MNISDDNYKEPFNKIFKLIFDLKNEVSNYEMSSKYSS